MAKTKISEYDATAANNTDIDSINIAEGMAPSNVNNAIRELMAHLKDGLGAGTPVYLDATNNRVGIGTTSPSERLHVSTVGSSGVQTAARFSSSTDASGCKIERDGSSWRLASQGALYLGADYDANGTAASSLIAFETDATERMRIDSSGNVGIGTSSPQNNLDVVGSTGIYQRHSSGGSLVFDDTDTADASTPMSYIRNTAGVLQFGRADRNASTGLTTNSVESMRINSSGDLLVGTTSTNPHLNSSGTTADNATALDASGYLSASRYASTSGYFNRTGTDGDILQFRKDGIQMGSLEVHSGAAIGINLRVTTNKSGFRGAASSIIPWYEGSDRDNQLDLGTSGVRWDDVYATNGSIQTSDQNEKQQIAALTNAEITAAKAISKLFKTFKWNDSVTKKGDAARTHSGVIAQEVEQAMTDAGLNAGDYAFFISDTWWETQTEVPAVAAVDEVLDEDGNVITEAVEAQEAYTRTDTYDTAEEAPGGATERNRKGIRYPELLSFIGAATEQRLASIESRLDALESA